MPLNMLLSDSLVKKSYLVLIGILFLLLFISFSLGQDPGAKYLIISHDNFYDAVLPLARWKHQKGITTKIVKLSEIGSSAAEIRDYVVDAYTTWQVKPEFLLLVGAPNYLPFPVVANVYSDNYYTNMDADIYNEILSGRLTCHDTMEAKTVVNKILLYERNPDVTDPTWFRKGCLIANTDNTPDDSIYFENILYYASLMANNDYVVIDTFSDLYGHNADDVMNSVNNGRGYLLYRGVGGNNWDFPFNCNPNQANNGVKLPIVLSITCLTLGTGPTPATAERWFLTGTPTEPRGAAGYFATSTAIMGGAQLRSAVAKGFADAVFIDKMKTFGEACENGRRRVYDLYDSLGKGEFLGFTTWAIRK